MPPQISSTFKKPRALKSPCASGQRAAELQRGGGAVACGGDGGLEEVPRRASPILVGFVRACSAALLPATSAAPFCLLGPVPGPNLFPPHAPQQQPAASSSTATHSPRLRPCSRNSCVHRVGDVIGARVLVRVLFASRPWRGEEASWRWDGSARRRKRSRRGRGRLGRLCSPRRRLGCLDARDPGCWRYVLRTSRLWGWAGGVWWFLLSCG